VPEKELEGRLGAQRPPGCLGPRGGLRALWSGRSSRVVAQAFAYASAVLSGRKPRPGAVSYRAKKLAETIIAMASSTKPHS